MENRAEEMQKFIENIFNLKTTVKGINPEGLEKVKKLTDLVNKFVSATGQTAIENIDELNSNREMWGIKFSIRAEKVGIVPIWDMESGSLSLFKEIINMSDMIMCSIEGKSIIFRCCIDDLWDIDFE